jgi:hypothetical protein
MNCGRGVTVSGDREIKRFDTEQEAELVRGLGKLDVTKNPNIITVKTLFLKLRKANIPENEAVQIVGNLLVEVNDEFVEKYLDETTDIYVDVILRMKSEFDKISPLLFLKYIESNKLTIKFSL